MAPSDWGTWVSSWLRIRLKLTSLPHRHVFPCLHSLVSGRRYGNDLHEIAARHIHVACALRAEAEAKEGGGIIGMDGEISLVSSSRFLEMSGALLDEPGVEDGFAIRRIGCEGSGEPLPRVGEAPETIGGKGGVKGDTPLKWSGRLLEE